MEARPASIVRHLRRERGEGKRRGGGVVGRKGEGRREEGKRRGDMEGRRRGLHLEELCGSGEEEADHPHVAGEAGQVQGNVPARLARSVHLLNS